MRDNLELEVKYHVGDLGAIEVKLRAIGAEIIQPRQPEINLRFDTPDGKLSKAFQVLRLRQDEAARLTYKGPSQDEAGVRVRTEIEFVVSDYQTARAFLEALGYAVVMMYEKYRTTYELDGTHITLDEMPYGDFLEIEGSDPETIHRVNERLGLDWEKRVAGSYTVLFEQLRQAMGLEFRDLSFENFKRLEISMEVIGVQPADS